MKKKAFLGLLVVIPVLMFLFSAAVNAAPAKDKIRIGWVTSMSGPYASGVPVTNGMVYELWIEEINAKGGINVKQYGKRLPIELIKYDDKSDVGAMTKLLEKVILEDKVDLILPPLGYGDALCCSACSQQAQVHTPWRSWGCREAQGDHQSTPLLLFRIEYGGDPDACPCRDFC